MATAYCPGAGAGVRRRPVLAVDFAGRLLPKVDADDDRRRREANVLGSALGPDTTSEGLRLPAFDDSEPSFSSAMETTRAMCGDEPKRAFLGANASTNKEQQMTTSNVRYILTAMLVFVDLTEYVAMLPMFNYLGRHLCASFDRFVVLIRHPAKTSE